MHGSPVLALTLTVLAAALPVAAQDAGPDEFLPRVSSDYRHREQVASANALVGQLGAAAEGIDTLFELSRLLSDPCDQVRWLSAQIERRGSFSTDAETRAAAETVLGRLAELEQAESTALGGCSAELEALKQQVQKIAAPPEPPWTILDPGRLAQDWQALRDGKARLEREPTSDEKLALFSRGIPADHLGLAEAGPWDQPRRVLNELARAGTLPPMWQLVRLQRELRLAEGARADWAGFAFPVDDTFLIAQALLERAMGVDAEDRGRPADTTDWSALAGELEANQYWAWAALAHLLEASSQAEAGQAANQAQAQWNMVAQVNAALGDSLWSAVARDEQAWLTRLAATDVSDDPGLLPLRADYRSAARNQRLGYERQFLAARGDAAEAIRLIQLAKAADLGLAQPGFQPLELEQLEGRFQQIIRDEVALNVFLLLEMIEIHGGAGQPSQYYAFRLSARDWSWTGGAHDSAVIGPFDTPAQLLNDALAPKVNYADLRILIAPDGPLDAEWFAAETSHLLERVSDRQHGWLCYLPSAAVLDGGAWTLDQTLRFWYRVALRAGQETIGCYPEGQQPWAVRGTLFRAPQKPLFALSIGSLPQSVSGLRRSRNFVAQFMDRKEAGAAAQQPLPAMLIFTAEAP